jgi:hypothetical protein
MGYDTVYTITIVAATKARRREIASEIVRHAWYPYLGRTLKEGEFKDPVLEFQNRGWRTKELLDLGGEWYDEHLHLEQKDYGNIRGIKLKEGERIHLLGKGDDDEDFYRIVATSLTIMRQCAITRFVDKEERCPTMDDYDEDDEHSECPGCGTCATIEATFPMIYEKEEVDRW